MHTSIYNLISFNCRSYNYSVLLLYCYRVWHIYYTTTICTCQRNYFLVSTTYIYLDSKVKIKNGYIVVIMSKVLSDVCTWIALIHYAKLVVAFLCCLINSPHTSENTHEMFISKMKIKCSVSSLL